MFTQRKYEVIIGLKLKERIQNQKKLFRKFLFSQGFRYRKNDKRLPGKPDVVLPKYRTVIFVNGCFWHKHEHCKYFVWPKSNVDFWKEKSTVMFKEIKEIIRNYQIWAGRYL